MASVFGSIFGLFPLRQASKWSRQRRGARSTARFTSNAKTGGAADAGFVGLVHRRYTKSKYTSLEYAVAVLVDLARSVA
jgi:hypothetical protein